MNTAHIYLRIQVLNFHSSDKEYYQEWYDEVSEANGWIISLNMPESTQYDFKKARIINYISFIEEEKWRVYNPMHLFEKIDNEMGRRIEQVYGVYEGLWGL